jgi:serine phosphatase RsbU (regulator of sigma subunit)
MSSLDLGAVVNAARDVDPAALPDVVGGLAAQLGATDVVLYLVDFAQVTLEPLPDRSAHVEVPHSEVVSDTMAGRAFLTQQPVTEKAGPQGVRLWVPIVEGSDRTGVLAVTLAEPSPALVTQCANLGLLVGYLIAVHHRSTDLYSLYRRRRALTLSASMQWDLLPPLVVKSPAIEIAGLVEPAYDVGGDCFDYAINGPTADVALFDPVGHTVKSAILAGLAVGAYRQQRREGRTLTEIHETLDDSISENYDDMSFVTGQLARLELATGTLQWTNAGHPAPLLLRRGAGVRTLSCPPTLPWGLGRRLSGSARKLPTVETETLAPGDEVLFFTDGAIEVRDTERRELGRDGLADLFDQQHSDDSPPEQTVRHLARAVLEYRQDVLADDSSFVLLRWNGGT